MHPYDRYLYEVYREKSITKAAAKLYIAQPSLSAIVKKAEKEKGFRIFDRSTLPLRLTESGAIYMKALEEIMSIERETEAAINDIHSLKAGAISIGGTNLFISFVLPPLFNRFNRRYPEVAVNMREGESMELSRMLDSGEIDLMLDNKLMDPGSYEKVKVCSEELLLAVPERFPVNEKVRKYALSTADIRADRHRSGKVEAIPLELFCDEPFLFLKPGNDTRERSERICREAEFQPKIRLELAQQMTSYNLSLNGMGISFIGDILIKNEADESRLVFYKLKSPHAKRDVSFCYKKNRYQPVAVRTFLEMIGREDEPTG